MMVSFQGIQEIARSVFWTPTQTRQSYRSLHSHLEEEPSSWPGEDESGHRPVLGQSSSYGRMDTRDLFGRDLCSDAFGSDASGATCVPSSTLCCVRSGEAYPSCHQFSGKGWCCMGDNPSDNCYVDQPSVCNQTDSIECTELGPGVEQACCPSGTKCAPGFTIHNLVRCNIVFGDLGDDGMSLTTLSTSTSTSSTSTATSTSIPSPTPSSASSSTVPESSSTTSELSQNPSTSTTSDIPATSTSDSAATSTQTDTSVTSQTPTPSNTNHPSHPTTLSPPKLAGVIVGAVVGICLIIVIGWLLYRRRRRRTHPGEVVNSPPYPGEHLTKAKAHESRQVVMEIGPSSPVRVFELDATERGF